MLTLSTRKFPTNDAKNLPLFCSDEAEARPEVVNSAQTSERREIKKVAALKMVFESHQSALCEGEGGI